jgi:DNA primase
MSVVDEVKSRLDIVDYIQRFVPIKKSGRTYKACCPFHSESTPSFHVDPDRQSWRCFGACATGGDIFAFAMRYNNWTFREALEELAKLAGVETKPQKPEMLAEEARLERLRGVIAAAVDYYHACLVEASDEGAQYARYYAREKRGLSDETLSAFKIGLAPLGWTNAVDALRGLGYTDDDLLAVGIAGRSEKSGRLYDLFRGRLMIPIRDERGRTVGFGGRALDPEEKAKYINTTQTPIFNKSHLLFGLDLAARSIRQEDRAVIVEGYMDMIQAHQAGYTNVVAQMGTALTEHQLKLLVPRYTRRVVLALDSDAAGQSATRRSLEVAREALRADYASRLSVEMRVLELPGAKDPDDFIRESPQTWAELVNRAVTVADYVIDMEMRRMPADASVQQREMAARALIPLLIAAENTLYRQENVQKLALSLRLPERELMRMAAEMQRQESRSSKPVRTSAPDQRAGSMPPSLDDLPPIPPGESSPAQWDLNAPLRAVEASDASGNETECLRRLLQQPDLYYHITRKFNEIANEIADEQDKLIQQMLGEFSAEDFRSATYRAIMLVFREALRQDRLAHHAYMRQQLDGSILREFDVLMLDQWRELEPRLAALRADLQPSVVKAERQRAPVEASEVMIELALVLRERRLRTQFEALKYLVSQGGEDAAMVANWAEQVRQTGIVLRRIQVERERQKSI